MPVSIHAPIWGATRFAYTLRLRFMCFNPRARIGRDFGRGVFGKVRSVSIHAPVWGATACPMTSAPTSSRFQSTRPYGARLVEHAQHYHDNVVSIHAPVWGATYQASRHSFGCAGVSIHAPVWGATGAVLHGDTDKLAVSIHAPVWGATC